MRPRLALGLLAAYVFFRAALGAALNPLYNGPDEFGHLEYVTAVAEGRPPSGVETRQLPTYYMLAALAWRLTDGGTPLERSFSVRLLSGVAGVVTLMATWAAARRVWPEKDAYAPLSVLWLLAPGHLFLLASVTNDPLAAAAAALSFLAAVWVWTAPAQRWRWAVWGLASAVALALKPTAVPVVMGALAAFAWRGRRALLRAKAARIGIALCVIAGLVVNAYLAIQSPTLSAAHSLARYWPQMALRAPVAYLTRGGVVETFRTWWYGYDYLVRWPSTLELGVAAACLALVGAAGIGLALGGRRGAPSIVWASAAAQMAFVLGRYGFGDVLQINMGGAAQAKSLFAALAPLALLGAAGISEVGRRLWLSPRFVTLGLFGAFLAIDAVSLAVTTWSHYRWWQLGGA
ncbi:MAG TPA: glycosyltransferase family 39 protein [Chloroflexota bacterium]|nr:glycosyltransferase family 39 protein [Chloroflexota bacterium]